MIVPILDSFPSSHRSKTISSQFHCRELALGGLPTVVSGWQKSFFGRRVRRTHSPVSEGNEDEGSPFP